MSPRLVLALLVALPALAVDFEKDVEPTLHTRCYMCHGSAQQLSGLRLDNGPAALKGGYSGPVIAPGDAQASKLIARVTSDKDGFRMPPAGPPLTDAEIASLRAWIDAGAEFPERAPSEKPSEAEKNNHWSFQPIERPEPPAVRTSGFERNPIDRFILARLEKDGVAPSPAADKITLARRVYFDLIGLPPSPEQIDAFLSDARPDAYERLVDELLASPHFGERWAMPWLDAARYADSDGYERDPLRPHAWRWRQWAIDRINEDQPFDQFTVEQIAGDLLPEPTLDQRIATGFLRNGIKNREAGVKNAEKRFEETIDRISTMGTVWLGLTVGCAQCHDHKYDAISQREFYQFYSFFANTVEQDIDAPMPGERGAFLRAYPEYRERREAILEEANVEELFAAFQKEMIAAMDSPGDRTDWDFQVTEWRAANNRSDWLLRSKKSELSDIEQDHRIDFFLSRRGPVINKDEKLVEQLKGVIAELAELKKELLPVRTQAYTMTERTWHEPTHIALRGDWRAKGLEVEPLTLAVLPELAEGEAHPRLKLARWIVDEDNPLTARVTVNRWWQELFGTGLVATVDDFGTQGEQPSHPKLLDWLASELQDSGWSRKHVVRLIATSATYRQSSADRPELAEDDPDNRRLARQNRLRLPAELVRDNALKVSGLLNPEIGGESVHPPQPKGIAELSYSKKPWPEDFGPERYRRGLYVFLRRTAPYPMLITFDAPDTLTAAVERERSNTPLQALNLLNDPVFVESAQALAVRVIEEKDDDAERLERIFRLTLGRAPNGAEKDRVSTYLNRQKEIFLSEKGAAAKAAPFIPESADPVEVAAWTGVARGLMNLDEFLTRE